MLEIAGSLWSVPAEDQLDVALRLKSAGMRRMHWDMSDGEFAAAGGFRADRAEALSRSAGLVAEAHLMATAPSREVDAWADFCDLVIVHAESGGWAEALDRISARGALPGLAISPATPASVVPSDVAVLCMSITPGTAGSAFDEGVLEKVKALRGGSASRRIGIDGGVQRRHAAAAGAAGADWLVVGTDLIADGGGARWDDLLSRQAS